MIELEKELHWDGNEQILYHLRRALLLHETRHLERLLDRGILKPEKVEYGEDGHFNISVDDLHN